MSAIWESTNWTRQFGIRQTGNRQFGMLPLRHSISVCIVCECVMKCKARCILSYTFNNIIVTSWRLVLLVEETGVPGENHRPAASH
jgi:hypothetical protein